MKHQYSESITHNTRLRLERHLAKNTQFSWGNYFIIDPRDIKNEFKNAVLNTLFACKPHIFTYLTGIDNSVFIALNNVGDERVNDALKIIIQNTCGIDKFCDYLLKDYCTYADLLGTCHNQEFSLKYDRRTYHVFCI